MPLRMSYRMVLRNEHPDRYRVFRVSNPALRVGVGRNTLCPYGCPTVRFHGTNTRSSNTRNKLFREPGASGRRGQGPGGARSCQPRPSPPPVISYSINFQKSHCQLTVRPLLIAGPYVNQFDLWSEGGPPSSESGTCKTVKARFWPWLSSTSP